MNARKSRFLASLLSVCLVLPTLAGCAIATGDGDASPTDGELLEAQSAVKSGNLVFVDSAGRRTPLTSNAKCLEDLCILEGAAALTIWDWITAGGITVVGIGGSYWAQNHKGRVGPFSSPNAARGYVLQAKKVNQRVAGQLKEKAREQKLPIPEDNPGADETYEPPANHTDGTKLPRGSKNGKSGFVDKEGRVWSKGPSRTKGEDFEWDVQTDGGGHINVSQHGKITH